jgi:hypothetical protein
VQKAGGADGVTQGESAGGVLNTTVNTARAVPGGASGQYPSMEAQDSLPLRVTAKKTAAQDNSKPQRSATGESEGLSYAHKPDHYMQGLPAWQSVGAYFKGGAKHKPNPFLGKHAGLTPFARGFFERVDLMGLGDSHVRNALPRIEAEYGKEARAELEAGLEKRASPMDWLRSAGSFLGEGASALGRGARAMGRLPGRVFGGGARAAEGAAGAAGEAGAAAHVVPPWVTQPIYVNTAGVASHVPPTAVPVPGPSGWANVARHTGNVAGPLLGGVGGYSEGETRGWSEPFKLLSGVAGAAAFSPALHRRFGPESGMQAAMHPVRGALGGRFGGDILDKVLLNQGLGRTDYDPETGKAIGVRGLGWGDFLSNMGFVGGGISGGARLLPEALGRTRVGMFGKGLGAMPGTSVPKAVMNAGMENAYRAGTNTRWLAPALTGQFLGPGVNLGGPKLGDIIASGTKPIGQQVAEAATSRGADILTDPKFQAQLISGLRPGIQQVTQEALGSAGVPVDPATGQRSLKQMSMFGKLRDAWRPVGAGIDSVLGAIHPNLAHLSGMQKAMLLGGLGLGTYGLFSRHPVLAGLGGLTAAAGGAPALTGHPDLLSMARQGFGPGSSFAAEAPWHYMDYGGGRVRVPTPQFAPLAQPGPNAFRQDEFARQIAAQHGYGG